MTSGSLGLAGEFARSMDQLGPFEPAPALAVAVSGGSDSMALVVLARDWARLRNGSTLALIVDHGVRSASAEEAKLTAERLGHLGISTRIMRLADLKPGPALAERARIMRYEVLAMACREAKILHLLLGHHAADQAETLAMRVLRGSQTHGLAGIAALRETAQLRLLRPLLTIDPDRLRRLLAAIGVAWVEDPSNQDTRATRPRLRQLLAANKLGETGLSGAASTAGHLRVREEMKVAAELARRVTIRPEGFALLSPGRIDAGAFASLVQTIGGRPYAASMGQISDLAAQPRPATLAGVRIMSAGRFGNGLLIVREEAAVMPPVEAVPGTIWDNRFRLMPHPALNGDANVGKLGPDAAAFRTRAGLPAAVLRTLPAVRIGKVLAAVPHLRYASEDNHKTIMVLFSPGKSLGGPGFVPAD